MNSLVSVPMWYSPSNDYQNGYHSGYVYIRCVSINLLRHMVFNPPNVSIDYPLMDFNLFLN